MTAPTSDKVRPEPPTGISGREQKAWHMGFAEGLAFEQNKTKCMSCGRPRYWDDEPCAKCRALAAGVQPPDLVQPSPSDGTTVPALSGGAEVAVPVGVIAEVHAERRRQVEREGWTTKHDDEHDRGSLADAAACYAASTRPFRAVNSVGRGYDTFTAYRDLWPWRDEDWKPKSRRRDLIRAAALIVAEIERLDRAAGDPKDGGA